MVTAKTRRRPVILDPWIASVTVIRMHSSGLSIKPKIKTNKIDQLKLMIEAWGMNPDEILTRQALSQPHRVYGTPYERQENHAKTLRHALKEMMKKELLSKKNNE